MATQTLATFDSLLKDVYRGPAVEQLNQDTWLIDQLERQNANDMGSFMGRRLVFPVHSARNRGRTAGAGDGGQLPAAGKQSYADGIVTIKSFFEAVELTDQVIRQSRANEGAFVKALETEIDGATADLRKDITRMAYGSGDGLLASCVSTQNARTISIDSGQYVAVGDPVDVLTKSDGTVKGSGLTVTAVSYTGTDETATQAAADITLSGTVSVTNADGVYVAGNRLNESDGLRNITATSRRLHAIDSSVAGSSYWNGNAYAANWTNVSEDVLMKQAQLAAQRGKPIDLYVTTFGVQRRLALQYQSQKRFNDANAVKVDGGYSAIMVSAGGKPIPVVADTDCVNGWAFGIRKDTFAWSEIDRPNWLEAPDGQGGIWHLKSGASAGSNVAAWQAYFGWYATLVCVRPQCNIQISQLKDDRPVERL